MNLCVAAVIATCHRPRELSRLLASLAKIESGLALIVIVDNGGDAEIPSGLAAKLLVPGENLGCGGGLLLAEKEALRELGDRCTHLLILDDDAVLPPDTLTILAAALESENAGAAYPRVLGPDGKIGWLPGFPKRRVPVPEQPAPFVWAQGICLLVTRRAIDAAGLHRDDFWVRGEDLEFSLRLTAHFRGIFVPALTVQHLPPPETTVVSRESEYLRHCALVQNVACISLLPHGRRVAWTIPSNVLRLIRTWGTRAIPDAIRALFRGLHGVPAGRGNGRTFLARHRELS